MRHISPNKARGITLNEVVVVASILTIVMAAFLSAMIVGAQAWVINAGSMELQSEVRRAAEWIAKDVRQARRVDIASSAYDPTSAHIKFQPVVGYNPAGSGDVVLGANFIEYTYDAGSKTLTRADSGSGNSWVFNNIAQAPFYTRKDNQDGTYPIVVIDPENPGTDSPVLQSGNLVIKIQGEKQTQSGKNISYALTEEVKIRN